jgi:hypothetical protein
MNTRTNPTPSVSGPREAAVGVDAFRTWNATFAAIAVNENDHSDQASQEAARVLIAPIPCLCSLALAVMTPL